MTATTDGEWKILGAGAIGCLWASELYRAGRSPTLLFRDVAVRDSYRRAGGLSFNSDGQRYLLPVEAMAVSEWRHPVDRLLVTTKAHQCLSALEPLFEHFTSHTVVVLMHNGMGVYETLQQRCPHITLYLASTTEGAYRRSPFELIHAGRGQTLIGKPGAAADAALEACAQSLACPGLPVHTCDNIEQVLWRKLAVNAAINPLTAIYNCRNGELLEHPQARTAMHHIAEEVIQLSATLGHADWVHDLEQTIIDVATATANNRSSMLQDIEAGRETEIDFINGYLCRLAEEHGLVLPVNREVTQRVRAWGLGPGARD